MNKLVIAAGLALAAGFVQAQPAPPAPTGLVVGSGNFYSPIVANLEEAVRFYRDGLGFEFQGEPGNADSNPQLRAMFGLPDARLRWQIGRAPGIPGGTFVSTGGRPIDLPAGERTIRAGVVRDPDGLFVVLIDSPPAP